MWYTYFNKDSWNIRIWKGYNLKYDSNKFCVSSIHHTSKAKNLLFKIIRNNSTLRSMSVFFFIVFIDLKGWYGSLTKINVEEKEIDDDYTKVLHLNRYGIPTRPTRSIDDLLYFIGNQSAMDRTLNSNSITEITDLQEDIHKGLDGIMNEEDRNIYNYYEKYIMNKSH